MFLNDNLLVINASKTSLTECMIKKKRGKLRGTPPTLVVEERPGILKEIKDTSYTRILGANVQGNLGWSSHLEGGKKSIITSS